MSVSACSSARRCGATASLLGAALALGFLLQLPAPVPAEARASRDSGRVVRHVRVEPTGIIRVDEYQRGRADRDSITVSVRGVKLLKDLDGRVEIGDADSADGSGFVIESDEAGLVRVFSDARVPAGRTVEGGVVAVFGSVEVEGTVAGDVVAVFGSVRLQPGAVVKGDAVAIGGVLDQPAGAQVDGQSLALGIFTPVWKMPTLAALLSGVLAGWLATLFLGWLLAMLFRERMLQIGAAASQHTALSFFLGLLSAPLFVICLALLFITVVGIPFALLLPFVYLLIVWAGQVAASYVLGCKLMRRRPGEGGLMGPIVLGTLMVALLFAIGIALAVPEGLTLTPALFFGLLGALLVAGLSTIGAGAVLLSRFGSPPAPAAGGVPAAPPVPGSSQAGAGG